MVQNVLKNAHFESLIARNENGDGNISIGDFHLHTIDRNTLNLTNKNPYLKLIEENDSNKIVVACPVIFDGKITVNNDLSFQGPQGEPGPPGPQGGEGPQGPIGDNADLPTWIISWDGQGTKIGYNYLISPKIFTGEKNSENGKLTGLLLGSNMFDETSGPTYTDLINKKGLIALQENEVTVFIDAETGNASFKGEITATSGKIGPFSVIQENGKYVLEYSFQRDGKTCKTFISDTGFTIGKEDNKNPSVYLTSDPKGTSVFEGKVEFRGGNISILPPTGDGDQPANLTNLIALSNLIKIGIKGTDNVYNLDDPAISSLLLRLNAGNYNEHDYDGWYIQFPFEISEACLRY